MPYGARHVRLSVRPWLHVFVDEKMRSLSLPAVSTELYFFHQGITGSQLTKKYRSKNTKSKAPRHLLLNSVTT
jgi:hypothetical protein